MFTFNGVQSTTYLIENAVKHSILPPLSPRLLTVPRRAGAYDFGVDIGSREITVDVTVKGSDYADLRAKVRDIANWLYQEELKPLTFSDEPDRTYYARVSGNTDLDEIVAVGRGTFVFLCPSPFADGSSINAPVAGTGGTVTNNGSYRTYPIFTVDFTASVTNFKISKGSKFVLINHSFVDSDSLVVDCVKNAVTVNGARVMDKVDISSEFFALEKGSNGISFDTTTGFTCSVDYTEKWL